MAPITPPAFPPIVFPSKPISNVSAFTYRDGETYIQVLERLRRWMNETLLAGMVEISAQMVENYTIALNDLVAQGAANVDAVNATIATLRADVEGQQSAFENALTAAQAQFESEISQDNADFQAAIQTLVDTINNTNTLVEVQHVTLTEDYRINVNPAWPTNQPINFRFTQDLIGGRDILAGDGIVPDRSITGKGMRPKLSKWNTALATGKATIVAIGDSITTGNGSTNLMNRWQTRLQRMINPSGPIYPFIPANPSAPSIPGWPTSFEGNVLPNDSAGLGWNTGVVSDAGAKLHFTFVGTRFGVQYFRGGTTGVMDISIDGGTPTTVDTNQSAGGSGYSPVWKSPVLPRALHTVTITRNGTSATDQYPYIQGIHVWNDDETTGVRILDSSHSGWRSSSTVNGNRLIGGARPLQEAGSANLMILALGTNDIGFALDAQTYKTNMLNIIAGYRTWGFAGSILLINMYKGMGRTEELPVAYLAALKEIADNDPDVDLLNMREYMPDVPTPYNDPAGKGYYADALHPTDKGYARMAEVIGWYVFGAPVATEIDDTPGAVTDVTLMPVGDGTFTAHAMAWA